MTLIFWKKRISRTASQFQVALKATMNFVPFWIKAIDTSPNKDINQ